MASKRSCEDEDHESERECKVTTPKRSCSFRESYTEKWPFIVPGKKGETFAFCEICACDFLIKSGGRDDVRRHVETGKHEKNARLSEGSAKSQKITGFFKKKSEDASGSSDVIRAEVMMVDLAVELNLPIAALDRFNKAVKVMFKDSDIAKNFKCGRTKATAIVKEVAAQTTLKLSDRMKRSPFTLSTDGSNERGGQKLFPLVIRSVDPDTSEVRSDVLSVPVCEGSATGENIFGLIENELSVHDIPFDNCIAFGSDNAPVMVGDKKGVYGFLKRKHSQMYLSGCVCHLVHIAAEKGAQSLPLNIEQVLIDVYYYMDKSSKRQGLFKEFQLLYELKEKKILKHVATRWLSIGLCLPRLLENWYALYDFFREQEASAVTSAEKDKTGRLKQIFKSPTNKLYCMFLVDAIKPFEGLNTALQCDKPMVQSLKPLLNKFFRSLLLRFVKPCAMKGKLLMDVDFKVPYNIKGPNDLIIGEDARNFISKAKEVHLRDERLAEFYKAVQQFFQVSCSYIKEKLPMQDELLHHAQVADPSKQVDASFASLKYFVDRFPQLTSADVTVNDLQVEFAQYQCADLTSCLQSSDRVDGVWKAVSEMREDGELMFKSLPGVMLHILTIPHSSAHCERIFSLVRKNKTDFRGSLDSDMLEALIVSKSRPGTALEHKYTPSQLADLKSACYRSLQQ